MGLHSMYARAPVVTPVRNGPTATRCPKEACTVRVAVKTIAYSDLQPDSCRLHLREAAHPIRGNLLPDVPFSPPSQRGHYRVGAEACTVRVAVTVTYSPTAAAFIWDGLLPDVPFSPPPTKRPL